MREETRELFNAYLEGQAELNGVAVSTVQSEKAFSIDPSIQQKLITKEQESSSFLGAINIVPVTEMKGEKLGLGISGPIASRTNTDNADRAPVETHTLERAEIGQIAALVASLPTKAPSADAVLSGLLSITGAAKLTASVAPAALAADANDLAPAGFASASRIKVSSTAVRSITGLVAADDGRVVLLENVGAYDINLKAESTASAAANRFAFHSDAILPKNGGVVTLVYDAGLARWLLAGGGKIADLQIGDLLETTANPGSRFLPTTGALYLNSAYPALRAVLGAYQNPMVSRLSSGSSARLYFLNGLWIAFVFSGSQWFLYSSADLVTWTPRTMPMGSSSLGRALSYGAGLYVWISADGTAIKTSPDLTVWTDRALPAGFGSIRGLARGATRFVAFGSKSAGVPGVIYSADGMAWVMSASAIDANIYCAAYNPVGGRWILGGQSGRIYRSTDDAATWADLGVLVTGNAFFAAVGGGLFAIGTQASPWLYTSPDGQAWTPASGAYAATLGGLQPSSMSFDGVAFLVSHSGGNLIARSADFANWEFQTASGLSGDINAVYRSGSATSDPYVVANAAGVWSGLDLSTTQFRVPTITGRASNTQVYIKAL